ncbi:MAG TPA: serine/threonine-protein kinase, partial [Thermoanaerobaculia bacterium]
MAVLELPPEDGEHIGPYRIVRILGRGGMGEVFLAWDPRLNRSVAIKRIRHDSVTTPILRQRLLNEAQAVGGLHHPAIVLIYDLLEDGGDDCIVMEYVEGGSLAERLNDSGPLEPALAARLAEEIASGLAAAHGARIIHRDLKSENVMITPSGSAKILDFGLAKPIGTAAGDSTLTAVGCVVGTCRSMSPEQARGAEVDERSDLFSFGVVLYEMLTGISPFQGANALETLSKVISERPPCLDTLRPGLPPRLVALLVRLLAKDPGERPVSATEVARELHAIAAVLSPPGNFDPEETVSAMPTGVIERWDSGSRHPAAPPPTAPAAPLQRRGRRSLNIAITLALLVVATAISYRLYSSRAHERPLRIVVPQPEVGDNPQLQLAASGLLNTSLGILGSLRDIVVVDPQEIKGLPRTSKEIARAAAADEVLIIGLAKGSSRDLGLITLRCIRGS